MRGFDGTTSGTDSLTPWTDRQAELRQPMRRSDRKLQAAAAVVFLALLPTARTQAQSQPPVNLGATSFLDGAPPGPGFYYFQYLQNYTSHPINNASGRPIPFPKPDLNVWVSL